MTRLVVQLTQAEVDMCVVLAAQRNMVARGSNVVDRQIGKQSALKTDYIGMVGEFAFCKYFNVFPDLAASPRSGSCDCVYKGVRIDIKSTDLETGRLLATTKENIDVDRYVLAIVIGNTVTFPGWIDKEDLIREENLIDLGHGKGYAIRQSQLNQFKGVANGD
jgi:hypothetical protein